jgi:hypothetical protein
MYEIMSKETSDLINKTTSRTEVQINYLTRFSPCSWLLCLLSAADKALQARQMKQSRWFKETNDFTTASK